MRLRIVLIVVFVLVGAANSRAGHILVTDAQTWDTGFSLAAGDILEIGPGGDLSVTGLGEMSGGAELIINGGTLTYTHPRLNVNDASIIVNSGAATFNTDDEVKFGDDWGPSYLYLNGGTFHCQGFELNYEREPHIIVGGGVFEIEDDDDNPQDYIDRGVVELAQGYAKLLVETVTEGELEFYRLSAIAGLIPAPADGAINVPLDVELAWTLGLTAQSYDVYFGDNAADVNDADNSLPAGNTVFKGNQDGNTYDPEEELDIGKTYYWRVDEVAGGKVSKGWLWRFTTVGKAFDPDPPDGAKGVAIEATLSWTPGEGAVSHDVYFGSSYEQVLGADNSQPAGEGVYKGNQDANSFAAVGLAFDRRYYWRIDELSGGKNVTGSVWSFRTSSYLSIDDLESYFDTDELEKAWAPGGGTWLYLSTKRSGPQIFHHEYHEGIQAMMLNYYNQRGYLYSEVERSFEQPQDWTKGDIKSMSLYFRGDAIENDPDRMYVVIEDATGASADIAYAGDAEDLLSEQWLGWRIDLTEVSAEGVNLAAVKKMAVGVGDRNASNSSGAVGYLYLDDIRLHPPLCLPESGPVGDLNDDCVVNLTDFGMMGCYWLENDFIEGVDPDAARLEVWYKFDEKSGDTAHDSSGNKFDGTLRLSDANSAVEGLWEAAGKIGGCIRFDKILAGYAVDVPQDAFAPVDMQMTISMWVNGEDPAYVTAEYNHLFSVHGGPGAEYEGIIGIETGWVNGVLRFWDSGSEAFYPAREQDWANGWSHYAFVKNIDQQYLRIYLNGELVSERASTAPVASPVDAARIGAATEEWHDEYTGLVDDFRIYSYALSQAEIVSLAIGTGGNLPIPERAAANLGGADHKIDVKDLSVMAENWLAQQFWP